MFNLKNIVNKITDRGRESNPNSPGKATLGDDVLSSPRTEGFLCPKCMRCFPSASDLQLHYESAHDDDGMASDVQGASGSLGFLSLHQEVGERYKQQQDGNHSREVPDCVDDVSIDKVFSITDTGILQKKLKEALECKAVLQSEKEHLEQRAAHLAQLHVTLKAASDEGESSQIALKERLKVVEAQLAHRESIDDAAVLRQELVQVQRVMDELNRERERERDALRAELQLLQNNQDKETLADMKAALEKKENEYNQLASELELCKQQSLETASKAKEEECSRVKELENEVQHLNDNIMLLTKKSKEESSNFQYKLDQLLKEKNVLQESFQKLQESSTENMNTSRQSIEELQNKLQACILEMQEKDTKIKSTGNQLTSVTKMKDSLRIELLQKSQLVEDLERKNSSIEKRVEELEKALAKSKETITRLESEHSELVAQIQAGEGATTAIQQLTQENNSLQAKLSEQRALNTLCTEDLHQKIDNLLRDVAVAVNGQKHAEMELENIQGQLCVALSDLERAREKIYSLQEQLRGKDTALKEMDSTYHVLKTGTAQLEKKYSELELLLNQKSMELEELTLKHQEAQLHLSEAHNEVEKYRRANISMGMEILQKDTKLQCYEDELKAAENFKEAIQCGVSDLQASVDRKEKEYLDLMAEKNKVLEENLNLEEKLKTVEDQLQVVSVQRASLETSLFELQKSMADLESEKKDYEEEKKREIDRLKEIIEGKIEAIEIQEEAMKLLMNEKRELNKELDKAKEVWEEVAAAVEKQKQLQAELSVTRKEKEKVENDLATESAKRGALQGELDKLLATLETTIKENSEKVSALQSSLDEVSGEKLALEAQLEAVMVERKTLLERCYASANEAETLHQTITDLRHKLDESQAALHELGRENQTLQLDIEKLIARKWAEDSDVNSCTLCHRDFTMILRKHHCRNCGQIFCSECSSKTAPVNNKKPVRVCDSCYSELTPK